MAHALLSIFWFVFYLSHSLLASWPVKRYIRSLGARFLHAYRLIYNFFSLAGLLGILYYQKNIPLIPLLSPQSLYKYLAYSLLSMGMLIMLLAMRNYKAREFIGLQKESELLGTPPPLVTKGLNAWVRHPLYFGAILFCLGLFFKAPIARSFIFLALTFAYLLLGIPWEEQKLLKLHGQSYLDYQKKTPMLIPYLL